MNDSITPDIYEPAQDPKVLKLLKGLIDQHFASEPYRVNQFKPHIWTLDQPGYKIFVIVTHLLVIFDAVLFPEIAKAKTDLFEELLSLNAHHVKNAKLCIVKDQVHLRVICELPQVNPEMFNSCLQEFGDLFPVFHEQLSNRFYPELESNNHPSTEQPDL